MRLVIGADHAGVDLKDRLAQRLAEEGHEVDDVGTHGSDSVDYPDFASEVGRKVAQDPEALGILICGTGQGMAMVANKIDGVRAAVCSDVFSARMAREHNDANVLTLGARVIGVSTADEVVDAFLGARFAGGRHAERVAKFPRR